MVQRLRKSDIREEIVSFFEQVGKIPTASEYAAAWKAGIAPHHIKTIEKIWGPYKRFVRMVTAQEDVRISALGSKPVEEEKPAKKPVVKKPAQEEPAQEDKLSPLERLRASTLGESSE